MEFLGRTHRFLLSSICYQNDVQRSKCKLRILQFPVTSPKICRIRELSPHSLPITFLQGSLKQSHTLDSNASEDKGLPNFLKCPSLLTYGYSSYPVFSPLKQTFFSLCPFHTVIYLLLGRVVHSLPKGNLADLLCWDQNTFKTVQYQGNNSILNIIV